MKKNRLNLILNKFVIYCQMTVIFFFLLLFPGCENNSSVDNIATVGTRKIDWKHLQRSYELFPKWVKGQTYKAAYRSQLDFLIDEKLFALAAYEEGLQNDLRVSGYLDFILKKEMIKELYRQRVTSRIKISEEEFEAAYLKMKKKIIFNFFYTPSQENAEAYFEKLKQSSFNDIQLIAIKQDYKDRSPEFTFGDMEEDLEAVVFELEKGEISEPIKVSDGYMVVQLIDGSISKFTSQLDFSEKKSKIEKVLFERKARKAANIYIKELMVDKNLTLNPPIFYILSDQLSKIIQDKVSETPVPIYLNDQEINTTRNSVSTIIDEVLITYRDGELTVRDFLDEMMKMPADLRPNINMAEQLKNAIGIVVRNEYLLQQAMKLGLEKDPKVIYETTIQTDEILSKLWLKGIYNRQLNPENKRKLESEEPVSKVVNNQNIIRLNQEESDKGLSQLNFQAFRIQVSDSLKNVYPVTIDTNLLSSKIEQPEDTIRFDPIRMVIRELFN